MKTANSITRKINSAITGLILMMSTSLLITSCQKEEMQQPSSENNTASKTSNTDKLSQSAAMAFSSIRIDHIAAKSLLADYSVTINSNGMATYEGRRNVHIIRSVDFKISSEALGQINNICKSIDFFKLHGSRSSIPDMPSVETTFRLLDKQSKLSDYEGQPAQLVSFRTKIENILDLSRFINATAGTAVAIDKM